MVHTLTQRLERGHEISNAASNESKSAAVNNSSVFGIHAFDVFAGHVDPGFRRDDEGVDGMT